MSEAPNFDPIKNFLQKADYLLRTLPTERRSRALAEAESHLRERASDLAGMSHSPTEAAQAAVTAFGGARAWARHIIDAYYADGITLTSRRTAIGLGAASMLDIVVSIWLMTTDTTIDLNMLWRVCLGVLLFCITGSFVAAFRARGSSYKATVITFLIFSTASLLISGLTCVSAPDYGGIVSRRTITTLYQHETGYIQRKQAEVLQLQSGLAIFLEARNNPKSAIPTKWHQPQGYIVPAPFQDRNKPGAYNRSVFKEPVHYPESMSAEAKKLAFAREPYLTQPALTSAVADWQQNAAPNITSDAAEINSVKKELAASEYTTVRITHFDLAAGAWAAKWLLYPTLLLLIFDWFGAQGGRWTYRQRKAKLA